MDENSGDPTRIVGRRPTVSSRQRKIQTIALVAYALFSVWMATRGRWTIAVIYTVLIVMSLGIRQVRPSVVDASGIRRAFPRRRLIPWSEVSGVAQAQPWSTGVRVQLASGRTMDLTDIPSSESAAIAALGGVALIAPPRTPLPPPRLTPRTDQDIEADVTRRAQALVERGRQLDAEYRSIQRRSSAPDQARTNESD